MRQRKAAHVQPCTISRAEYMLNQDCRHAHAASNCNNCRIPLPTPTRQPSLNDLSDALCSLLITLPKNSQPPLPPSRSQTPANHQAHQQPRSQNPRLARSCKKPAHSAGGGHREPRQEYTSAAFKQIADAMQARLVASRKRSSKRPSLVRLTMSFRPCGSALEPSIAVLVNSLLVRAGEGTSLRCPSFGATLRRHKKIYPLPFSKRSVTL